MNKLLLLLLWIICADFFAQTVAFPGAEGCGINTVGGRGGRVLTVTNLNDSGEGSLRHAIEQSGPRIVVFAVDGTIELQSKLVITNDSITIAGQSAPGEGICLKGYPFYIRANNVIIRYIRARMGDVHHMEDDAMGAMNVKNLIIDHCSVSWSVDECLSVYKSENVTVQWCMITHSLSKSAHSKGAHGFGGIWGGSKASYHHNLLAHHSSRNPRFASDGFSPVDFRNNVVFNWGYKAAYGGGRNGRINFIANYYKPGPATSEGKRAFFLDPAEDMSSAYFLKNNVMEGSYGVSSDNWLGVSAVPVKREESPFDVITINEEDAKIAYERVLAFAGCSFRRDSYDKRVVEEVKTGIVTGGESFAGGNVGIIDSQDAVGGWPLLKSGKSLKDSDKDGMPDKWEKANKLKPHDASDASGFSISKEYSNIEVYLNSVIKI